ncbi:MAG TPA: CHRD domain-containing protein [Thermoanaerobaculia bacterium]
MKRSLTTLFLVMMLIPAAASAQSFSAILSGANEVPAGDPDGSGLAVVSITGTTVRYTLFVQNIAAPTAAHIHRGVAGVAGEIVVGFPAPFSGGGVSGEVIGVSQTIIDEILANPSGFYVNVHNADFAGGAIRGQLTASGGTAIYVPVVGKVRGGAGTNFVSDLRIVNRGMSAASVTLEYFASNAAGLSAPTASKTISVAPGSQAVINDLLESQLGVTSGLGALRAISNAAVRVDSRIFNDLRSEGLGTTGFVVAGREAGEASTSGILPFLSQAPAADIGTGVGFRTNVGYFNPNATAVTATFTAHRTSDGSALGSVNVTIPPFSQLQQQAFALISTVTEADRIQSDFYVTYTASAPIFVYGAVTDNKTGDGVFIE